MGKTLKKHQKCNSNSSYKARGLIFLMVLMIMLMSISLISAYTFDDVLRFDENEGEYGIYTVKNIFGVGSDLATVELTDNSDSCSTNCYAEGTTTLYISEQLVQQVRFRDEKKTKYKNIKEYQFYVEDGIKNKTIIDYEKFCSIEQYANGTYYDLCIREQVGSHYEYETKWKKYDGEVLEPGTYKWRLEGKKNPKETVDWTIDFFGFESEEWALWDGNEGPFAYWKLDETAGVTAADSSTGVNYPGTAGAATYWYTDGLINGAVRLDKNNSESVTQATLMDTVPTGGDFSIQVWFNPTGGYSGGTDEYLWQKENNVGADRITLRLENGNGKVTLFYEANNAGNQEISSTYTTWAANTWYHAVVTVDDAGDTSLYINGVLNDSVTYANTLQDGTSTDFNLGNHVATGEYFDGRIDEFSIWNRTLSAAEALELYNGGAGVPFGGANTTTLQIVNISRPLNNTNHTTNSIEVNCTGGSQVGMRNLSIWLDGVYNYTESNSTIQNISFSQTLSIPDGTHSVFCRGTDGWLNSRNTTNITFRVDANYPDIKVDYPNESLGIIVSPLTLNWSVFDTGLDQCWYEYDGTNTSITCLDNTTTFAPSTTTTLRIFANDTFGQVSSNTTTWDYTFVENAVTYNTTVYETSYQNFTLNLTYNGSMTINSATLVYNGTEYAGSSTQADYLYLSRAVDIPAGTGNVSYYWSLDYGAVSNSTVRPQTINPIVYSVCNSSNSGIRFNVTFIDEDDGAWIINGTLPTTNWNYYLGSGTQKKSYSYNNNVGRTNYTFCFSVNQSEIYSNYSLNYRDQYGNYPQRTYSNTESFTNVTTDRSLYLLASGDGIYVTFQVINPAEQPLSGTYVQANRTISGAPVTVGEGTTGADGGITFWLNPDYEHTFTFNNTDYDIYQTTFSPTQTSYTVTLGGGGDTPTDDFNQGISYSILPVNTTLFNNQTYTFSFVLTSSYWTVTEFGFQLFNSSGALVASDIESTNGGTATKDYVVNNNTAYLEMQYYYVISGNYTNSSRTWVVLSSEGTEWSIKNFFDDFTSYTTIGMFGIGNFGKAILVFIIIFIFTGIMSYKFGLVSPVGITTMVFSLVVFFDVGVGLFTAINPASAVPYFPTVLMGIILIGVLFREVYR